MMNACHVKCDEGAYFTVDDVKKNANSLGIKNF